MAELRRLIAGLGPRSDSVVLEGPRTVGEALDAGLAPRTVAVPESQAAAEAVVGVCRRLGPDADVLVVADPVFERLAPSVSPQPMLAVADRPMAEMPSVIGADDLVLVLIGVADPGNAGTIVRAADAFGAASVVTVGGADPWGPKAVRASAGSVLRVPVVTGFGPVEALSALRRAGARIVAADVRGDRPHDSGPLAGGGIAVVLGSEPRGLDRAGVDGLVDDWVRIDMVGRAESLNVAMAATLLAHESRASRPRPVVRRPGRAPGPKTRRSDLA